MPFCNSHTYDAGPSEAWLIMASFLLASNKCGEFSLSTSPGHFVGDGEKTRIVGAEINPLLGVM